MDWKKVALQNWKWILGGLVLLFVVLHFRSCTWNPFFSGVTTVEAGPGAVEVTPNNVRVTPRPSKANPKPTPEDIWKPKEGTVTVDPNPDGTADVKIQRTGFCFEPKIGAAYDGDLYPVGGLRFFFHERFGLEALASERYAHLGVDFRVGNLAISAGARQPYASITEFSTIGAYGCLSVFLK